MKLSGNEGTEHSHMLDDIDVGQMSVIWFLYIW